MRDARIKDNFTYMLIIIFKYRAQYYMYDKIYIIIQRTIRKNIELNKKHGTSSFNILNILCITLTFAKYYLSWKMHNWDRKKFVAISSWRWMINGRFIVLLIRVDANRVLLMTYAFATQRKRLRVSSALTYWRRVADDRGDVTDATNLP